MKLSKIIIFSFILVGILAGFIMLSNNYFDTSNLLEQKINMHLESRSQLMEDIVEDFVKQNVENIQITATHENLSNDELKEIIKIQEDFEILYTVDSEGMIITSSDETFINEIININDFLKEEETIILAYTSKIFEEETLLLATPFKEGFVVTEARLGVFDSIILDQTGLGETGESLLAYQDSDGDIVFFTQRRFEANEMIEASHLPMAEAVSGVEKTIYDINDYRGEEVIAITKYIEVLDVGLVVKIDEAEALGETKKGVIYSSIKNLLLIIFLISFMGFFVSRYISKPIKDLTESVDEISKGNFEIQIKESKIFEINNLIDSLDRILASLKLAILRTGSSKHELGIGTEEAISEMNKAKEKSKKRTIQLERFSKLSENRELKMIELKKRIKVLERKIKK